MSFVTPMKSARERLARMYTKNVRMWSKMSLLGTQRSAFRFSG